MQKRRIFIGDVHGCYDELMALLEKVSLTDHDELYFVGDLINKGPKSLEVVEFVRHRPNTYSVLGNHEFFDIKTRAEIEQFLQIDPVFFSEGEKRWVQKVPEIYGDIRKLFKDPELQSWLRGLPHIIERDDFIVVHGGLHPDYGGDTPRDIAIMIRMVDGLPWYDYYQAKKPVIYGHWAADGLRIRPNTIGLDTGCCFGGHLTAYCLDTGEVWQVRANHVYKNPGHWGLADD